MMLFFVFSLLSFFVLCVCLLPFLERTSLKPVRMLGQRGAGAVFVGKVVSAFENFNVEPRPCVCVRVYVCVRACPSLPSHSSETVEGHHRQTWHGLRHENASRVNYIDPDMLLILTLTGIQGHTYLNHDNNKCLIISETIQAMPIKFAVKIVRLKVCMTNSSPMTLTLIQVRLKLYLRSQWVGKGKKKNQRCMLPATKQVISIHLVTMVVHCLCKRYMA